MNPRNLRGDRNICASFGMSSIRPAVKTIASFILHFLDTNYQGLDLQRGWNLMRMSETVFMVTTQICQNELLQSNKWSFPNDARQTEISYSKLSEEGCTHWYVKPDCHFFWEPDQWMNVVGQNQTKSRKLPLRLKREACEGRFVTECCVQWSKLILAT